MDDLASKRELHRGFGDALARAFEFAMVTLIFVGLGFVLDGWLGTTPLFMILLTLLGVVGQFVRFWYAYDATMKRLERDRQLTRVVLQRPRRRPSLDVDDAPDALAPEAR